MLSQPFLVHFVLGYLVIQPCSMMAGINIVQDTHFI